MKKITEEEKIKMSELKRTQLYDTHVEAGATMVDFGGWEMPIQYPDGIIKEHLYTRSKCSLFDVSHMGRLLVEGSQNLEFLQHVVTSNVAGLELGKAQYCIIQDENGCAVDDAYLYRFEEDRYMIVVNASNTDKDIEHFKKYIGDFDCTLRNITSDWASIAVQGPESKNLLMKLNDGNPLTEPMKNSLGIVKLEGHEALVATTGYTGEPLGFEVYVHSEDAKWLWNRLIEFGARAAGLGARDTLRTEAMMPLYGHEMGVDHDGNPIPIYAVSLAKFSVSFNESKGDFVGKEALAKQKETFERILNRDFSDMSAVPRSVKPITLLGRGVMRAGMPIYKGEKHIGWVTSGTMIPYFVTEGEGIDTIITEKTAKRAIGICYVDSDTLEDDKVEVDIRGKRVEAVIPARHMSTLAPPYAHPLIYGNGTGKKNPPRSEFMKDAVDLLNKAAENHEWRQRRCINLIPSENTSSMAVRMLSSSDPSCRYAEHKKIEAFYDKDIFYYQGTKFIDEVEQLLADQMCEYLGCTEAETRVTSGQMANTVVFSALLDWKNRLDRKHTPNRLGYVLNNHIIKGGHLSAQPMGAMHDYIAVDPVTEKNAVVNFPVCKDNIYKIDVEETKKVIEEYKPELIIFGKSMVLYKEPVAEIRKFVDEQNLNTTIMYDMAHVLGLVGDHFQKPFEEGAEIVTGSTHKTFFGPQRGVIGVNYTEDELKYGLWETIQRRTFPGSVSNHHLGTQLGQLMAVYEMNCFKDEYQSAIIANAKHFAKSLSKLGLNVCGDPAIDFTQTHQVLLDVGYGKGAEIAERLEKNNIIVNYQATPDEEGFTASGALRMGVSEMTRFGFEKKDFEALAGLMADCILHNTDVSGDVEKLRAEHLEMRYCFSGDEFDKAYSNFIKVLGM